MAFPSKTPAPAPSGDSTKPQSGQASKLAANLAQKHSGAKTVVPKPAAPSSQAGTKGGRLTVAEESARYLSQNGLVAVPAQTAGAINGGPVAPPVHVVSPEFVGEVTEKCLKGVESWRVSNREGRVSRILKGANGGEYKAGDEKLVREFGDSSKAPPGCIETVGKCMREIAMKYPAILQWTPELAGLSALGTWFMKDAETERRLIGLEKLVQDRLKNVTPPPLSDVKP